MKNRIDTMVRTAVCSIIALFAFLAGCRSSPEAGLERIGHLRRDGKTALASTEVDQWLSKIPQESPDYWRFVLQKAQLLERTNREASLSLLQQGPPVEPRFGSIRARFKLEEAFVDFILSRYSAAEQAAKEAEKIAGDAAAIPSLASTELLHAQILSHLGRFQEAEVLARAGNKHVVTLHDREREAYGLDTLAKILKDQSRYEEALPYAERELAIREQLGDRPAIATSLIGLGLCYSKLGDAERALDFYQKAEKIGTADADRPTLMVAFGNAGAILLDRGDLKGSRKYLENALTLADALRSPKDIARWKSNLATLLIEGRDWQAAATYNDAALELRRKFGEPIVYSQINAARILDGQGKTTEADRLFSDVVKSDSNERASKILAHSGLARMYARLNNDDQAGREYQAALRVVDESRSTLRKDENKLAFLASEITVHGEYIDHLMAQGKTETALEIAEATRARILQERTGAAEITRTIPASYYKKIAQANGATLVSYWLGPKRSYLWLITPQRVVAYPLPPQEKLRRQVEHYRRIIESESDPLNEEDTTGSDLFEALLGPIVDRLTPGGNLMIVPDGALNALNFETLPVPGGTAHYFIEDAAIAVVPSLNLLVQNPPPENREGRILLIGNAEGSEEQFPKLPFAQREIDSITRHFEPSKVVRFQEAAAIPAAYMQADGAAYSYVHFTAHASTNGESPLESAIILSGKTGTNRLTAGAVREHHLNAKLVIISACRSAGAKTYAGEGLVGFMWAFFRAGAHSIIAGLWDVSDESTPILMDELYRGITTGMAPARALRAAKLKVISTNQTFSLPYFWGPFQLYIQSVSKP